MIRTSHLVHKGMVNIYPGQYPEPTVLNDMTFGNKIALLSGDYLLANSCMELASLRNQDVSGVSFFKLFFMTVRIPFCFTFNSYCEGDFLNSSHLRQLQ